MSNPRTPEPPFDVAAFTGSKYWTVPCWRYQTLPPLYEYRHQAETACNKCLASRFCQVHQGENCAWLKVSEVKKP